MEILESSQQKLYAPNLICVGIDRCENGDFIGRVWEPYDASAFEFTGINEMVIQSCLDTSNFAKQKDA